MTELGQIAAPPTPEELLKVLASPLKKLVEEQVENDSSSEKIWQYNNARRNYLMFRGMQFLAPVMRDGYSDYAPVGSIYGAYGANAGNGDGEGGCYDYTRNIFRGKGIKFIAVVGQRAPNVTALADDPDDENSTRSCRSANECNAILNSWWGVDEKNIEVATYTWTTGPAYIYTPWNADGVMYGFRQEPKYRTEQQPMGDPAYHCMNCGADSPQPGPCPQCGVPLGPDSLVEPPKADVPVPDGVMQYPNGRVECYVVDSTMVTTPFYVKSDLKYCPRLKYEYEEDKSTLIHMFPELRGKGDDFGTGGGLADRGRQVRDAIVSPTGAPTRNSGKTRWLFTRIWLSPKEYATADDQTRKLLDENFATGIKITRVNGETVKLEEERLDEVWAAVQPSASATLNADPVGQDLVSAQLLTNHVLNIAAETIERGNPLTFVDPRVVNLTAWNRQKSRPNQVIPTLAAVGSTLGESFYQTQPSQFSNQMQPWIASVEQGATEDVGVTPEIFGGGNADTARQAEINKNAAMMQLGIPWAFIRKAWERAKRNGVLQLVKYGPATVREGKNVVELSELTGGAWHFEADEAIPTTWGQQRDFVMFMLQQGQEVQAAWGLSRPENIALNKSLVGMEGMYTPGLDDADKVQDTIQKLLQAQPIQKQNPDGSPDTQPSIPPDEFEDDANLVVQLIQSWAQSKPGRDAREQNEGGYSNVIAYGVAYKNLLNPPPPPPPPVVPKVSVSVSSKDLAPNQTQAILQDANLQVPPPQPPPGMPVPMPPGGSPAPPQQGLPVQ